MMLPKLDRGSTTVAAEHSVAALLTGQALRSRGWWEHIAKHGAHRQCSESGAPASARRASTGSGALPSDLPVLDFIHYVGWWAEDRLWSARWCGRRGLYD